jgi:hypothetical protein
MDKELYHVIFRSGMTGGTARSIYKMLASSDDWESNFAEGAISLAVAGVPVCDFIWTTLKASSVNEALAHFNKKLVNADGFEFIAISYEEAGRIDAGEKVDESPGSFVVKPSGSLVNEWLGNRDRL